MHHTYVSMHHTYIDRSKRDVKVNEIQFYDDLESQLLGKLMADDPDSATHYMKNKSIDRNPIRMGDHSSSSRSPHTDASRVESRRHRSSRASKYNERDSGSDYSKDGHNLSDRIGDENSHNSVNSVKNALMAAAHEIESEFEQSKLPCITSHMYYVALSYIPHTYFILCRDIIGSTRPEPDFE